jgi:glycosyltransferase involved in cell wall biosynthesis
MPQPTSLGDNKPKVTVVMAAYNAMPFLPAAVESILNQTYRDFRFIIVNDGSTDDSAEYLASIEDPRLTVVYQENQGQQAAANNAIEMCDTEYIARMDADDISDSTRLEKQIAFLEDNRDVGMVGSQFMYLGRQGTGTKSALPTDHESIYSELINNRHAVCNATTVFRTKLFRELGGYWKYNISEDWDLFLRAGEKMKLANMSENLLQFRFHPGSINGRRMFESQLHNEYACELARRRNNGQPKIDFDEFWANHKYSKWPRSMFFRMDCLSVSIYRVAMADILDGNRISGYGRMLLSMVCSPHRTVHRIKRMIIG